MTTVATAVLMLRTSSASPDAIHIPLKVSGIQPGNKEIKKAFNSYSCYLLVALAGVFSKIDSSPEKEKKVKDFSKCDARFFSPKHAPYVGMSLIKALLCNRLQQTFMIVSNQYQLKSQTIIILFKCNTWINGEPWKSILSLLWL